MAIMRTCKGRYWQIGQSGPNGQPGHYEEFENGVFHQWGSNYEEFENGAGNYSVAIVELQDGKVIMPNADEIQFTGIVEDEIYG